MKKRWMKLMSLSLAAVMTFSLAACGSGGDDSKGGSDSDKTITYWNIGTEGADKAALEYAVNAFNENTDSGYTVENVAIQNDNYKERLVVAMSSGECPDMYTSWSGGPMNEYIDSGFAQPVDELYEEYGHIYAVPTYNVSLAGIFYNTEIFEKYNLEVPTTLSELETVCDTLVENGITPFALANATKWTGSMLYQCLVARYGGLEPFQAAVDGSGSFEDECFQWAGEKIQEWVEKGYFPEGVNSLDEDAGQAKQLMYQESAAMMLIGSWYTGTFCNRQPGIL